MPVAAVAETARTLVSSIWRGRVRPAALGYAFNPLLVRDLRSFLRGRRPIALQIGYLLLPMIAMAIAALVCRQERIMAAQHGGFSRPNYGEMMFVSMFETQVVLLCLVVIGYSAGAIALEHEKRTFEMLAVTTLSTLEIVLGKVAAITALCAMLLATSLPLAALCVLLGGVSPGQILLAYVLLLYSVPMWAAGCVLVSVLVGRAIGAYITAMVGMAMLLLGASYVSGIGYYNPNFGAMSPFVLPLPGVWAQFTLFKAHVPAWIPPLTVYGLLCALCVVAAAEAVPLHKPRRSTALRLLLFSTSFVLVFLDHSAMIELAAGHQVGTGEDGLLLAWICACLSVPIFTSYLPPGRAYQNPIGWLFGALPIRGWLQRESNAGWRAALVLFGAFTAGTVLPYAIAEVMGVAGGVIFTDRTIAMLLFAMMLYAISICGYSFWGAAFSLAWRDRRISAVLTVFLILALNTLAVYSQGNPYSFRKLKFLVHPLLMMTSPIPAASAALGGGTPSPFWWREWGDPRYRFGASSAYQVAVMLGALWYLRRVGRKAGGSHGG
jgi:ABC-type transport system involved in multi-copper enzyme maturation permease subunit